MSIPGYEPAATATAPANVARPVLAATWSAHVLDTGAVHDELNRLWGELGIAQATRPPEDDALIAGVLVRANTLNLICVAHSTAEADRIQDAIVHLTDYHPSRAIILVADPARKSAKSGLDVRVSLLEQKAMRGRPAIRFECVHVEGDKQSAGHLASIASPLLVPELPDFLWWPGDSMTISPLFDELAETADRLIVDSAAMTRPAAGLPALAALVARAHTLEVSDFAWARLRPWRQLIAQFFDQPGAQPCLTHLDEVTIGYAGRDRDGASGLSGALLMLGWLASRLRWESAGPLHHANSGWAGSLRGGAGGQREIAVRLRPIHGATAPRCLAAVTLAAHKECPGTFAIERTSPQTLTTASETPNMPRISRMVYTRPQTDTELLGTELQIFGDDPIFEAALATAARLLPQEQEHDKA